MIGMEMTLGMDMSMEMEIDMNIEMRQTLSMKQILELDIYSERCKRLAKSFDEWFSMEEFESFDNNELNNIMYVLVTYCYDNFENWWNPELIKRNIKNMYHGTLRDLLFNTKIDNKYFKDRYIPFSKYYDEHHHSDIIKQFPDQIEIWFKPFYKKYYSLLDKYCFDYKHIWDRGYEENFPVKDITINYHFDRDYKWTLNDAIIYIRSTRKIPMMLAVKYFHKRKKIGLDIFKETFKEWWDYKYFKEHDIIDFKDAQIHYESKYNSFVKDFKDQMHIWLDYDNFDEIVPNKDAFIITMMHWAPDKFDIWWNYEKLKNIPDLKNKLEKYCKKHKSKWEGYFIMEEII